MMDFLTAFLLFSVTRDCYTQQILTIFMDDKERQHHTLVVQELLESEYITRRDDSAFSLHLNLI